MRIKTPWGETVDLEATAEAIWEVLERGVRYALATAGSPPDPYKAGIAYRREPKRSGRRRDYYQPWWEVLAQLHGDCEDLAMMLVAYLRATGIDPTARVALIEWPSGGWHAVVLRKGRSDGVDHRYNVEDLVRIYGRGTRIYGGPDIGWDPVGWYVEDASRRLGMRDSARGSVYSPLALLAQREPRGEAEIGRDPYVPFEVAGVKDAQALAQLLGEISRIFGGGRQAPVVPSRAVGPPVPAPLVRPGPLQVHPSPRDAGEDGEREEI